MAGPKIVFWYGFTAIATAVGAAAAVLAFAYQQPITVILYPREAAPTANATLQSSLDPRVPATLEEATGQHAPTSDAVLEVDSPSRDRETSVPHSGGARSRDDLREASPTPSAGRVVATREVATKQANREPPAPRPRPLEFPYEPVGQ